MHTKKVTLFLLLLTFATLFLLIPLLLPTAKEETIPTNALDAYAKELRTGETSPESSFAQTNGFEVIINNRTFLVLIKSNQCWAKNLKNLNQPSEKLSKEDCTFVKADVGIK